MISYKSNPIENELTENFLIKLVTNANADLPGKEKMNDRQVLQTALTLLGDRPALSAQDWIILFRMGVSGKFGKSYHSVSLELFQDWASQYEEILAQKREDYHRQKTNEYDAW